MDSFTSEERIVALNKAIKKIRRIKRSRVGYCYGISDCWTQFCEYDNFLRNNDQKLKNIFLGYTSQEEWFATLLGEGFTSPIDFIKGNGWVEVPLEETEVGDAVAFTYKQDSSAFSLAIKTGPRQWCSSSNLPDLDVLDEKYIRKQYLYSARAVK